MDPEDTPITIPLPEPIVAIVGTLLIHAPPPPPVSVVVAPMHRPVAPLIVGVLFTVIVRVAIQPPTLYVINAVPLFTVLTNPVPDPIVILVLAVLHNPPGVTSVSVIVDPMQTLAGPPIAAGTGFTVIVVIVAHPVAGIV